MVASSKRPADSSTVPKSCAAIKECCIIASPDERKGETVKVVVVLKEDFLGKITGDQILSWSRFQMAAYKAPRLLEFSNALPRTASGKLMWRALQEREFER